jgi:hypothetical protein
MILARPQPRTSGRAQGRPFVACMLDTRSWAENELEATLRPEQAVTTA